MSGVEAVGLALGILPLLVSSIEHYDDCVRPFIRYKNFPKEADRFRHLLNVQKTIFRNQCRILLEGIIEHDVATGMLNGSSGATHPSWLDASLEEELCRLLGDSKVACVTTIEMIEERLRDIESETRELETAVDQDIASTVDSAGKKSWRRRTATKLRFSVSKPRLDRILSDLRSLNDDFRTLSSQTLTSTSLHSQRQEASPTLSHTELEKYQIIGQASRQVYEALGKACTKHTEHQAHFCVEVEQAHIMGDHSAQVKFNMAYTHMSLAGSVDPGDLIWFMVDSTSGDAMHLVQTITPIDSKNILTESLKRQIEPHACPTAKRAKKSVRFQSCSQASEHVSALSTATIATAILSNDSMRKDFCDFIRRRLREPLQASECVGQLISGVPQRPASSGIPLYERLHLAKTLAVAVLQYHATPWLKTSWRSEDVCFFGNESALIQEPPSLTSPHLNVKVKGPCGQISRASSFPSHNLARNPLLFSLGVVLLEIAYNSTMESLQRPIDLDNGREIATPSSS